MVVATIIPFFRYIKQCICAGVGEKLQAVTAHGRIEIDLAEVRQRRVDAAYLRAFEYPLDLIFR